MRGLRFKCALVATVAAGVAATAATALSTRAPATFDQPLTLAGGAAVDPDAPIATARYGDTPKGSVRTLAAVDLAGAPSQVALAGAPTAPSPTSPPALIRADAATVSVSTSRQAPAPWAVARAPLASGQGLVRAERRPVRVVKVDEIKVQPFAPPGGSVGARTITLNASALVGKVGTSAEDQRKGRWVLFAASSGRSLSFNVVRDTLDGWRGAGLSQERLARFGTHQLGVGWRKKDKQIALSATRRKLQAEAYSDRDVVYGVTISMKPR